MRLIDQIRDPDRKIHYSKDIISGIIVALVSIPISLGYAQIAGLPAVYGLYGSLLPILTFAFLSTSPQFVVGVDAMPAAMVGTLLAEMGIMGGTEEAMRIVPVVSVMVAVWFLLFYLLKAGRIVRYISSPVMGGFISGVGMTIILMQVPKLFGGSAGTGELVVLLRNIGEQISLFNPVSAGLGFGTVIIILAFKKLTPRVPMTVIMIGVGALIQVFFHVDQYGVALLPALPGGLPSLILPDATVLLEHGRQMVISSLEIAAVIMAQTLLASGNYARKYRDDLDNNAELLAYAVMNVAGAAVGCCPINGSVSRSGIADSFGCRSQIMSVAAAGTMVLVLLFATPVLQYLPVPVLTGIVMCALIGILEIGMFRKLLKAGREELIIFLIAFFGVLFLGTVAGVVIGVILSFVAVVRRSVSPPRTFVGRIPGKGNFYSIDRNSGARPICQTLVYRFGGNLFFANIDLFLQDIRQAIREDTRQIVVDARGISSVDITAMERLLTLYQELKERGIRFYIAEHEGTLNDQMRKTGGQVLIEEGVVRRTISLALRDAGLQKPYDLEEPDAEADREFSEPEEKLAELEWAFGPEAEQQIRRLAERKAEELVASEKQGQELLEEGHGLHTAWGTLGRFDEGLFLDQLEADLERRREHGDLTEEQAEQIDRLIEMRRLETLRHIALLHPEARARMEERLKKLRAHMQKEDPERYLRMTKLQEKIRRRLQEVHSETRSDAVESLKVRKPEEADDEVQAPEETDCKEKT